MTRTIFQHISPLLPVLLLILTLAGCASSETGVYDYDGETSSRMAALAETEQAPAAEANQSSTDKANNSRKIHYNGRIGLLVSNPRTTIKQIVELVNTRKGFVERIHSDVITVHVPADSFEVAFREILTLGKVLEKSVTAEDISDQYRATRLRLKIARTTRQRLLALLKKASEEEDKLQLLKQIEEITATIETLEAQFELLKTKVNYAKITVSLTSYSRFDGRYRGHEPIGLAWINRLAPLDDSVAWNTDELEFSVPDGMLRIKSNRQYWLSESGDKVVFRGSQRNNDPKGDRAFWSNAIKLRLSTKYQSVQSIQVGDYELLRLMSYDSTPHIYYVGLKVDKNKLKLVELYFPDNTLEEKYKNNIFDSIKAGEI